MNASGAVRTPFPSSFCQQLFVLLRTKTSWGGVGRISWKMDSHLHHAQPFSRERKSGLYWKMILKWNPDRTNGERVSEPEREWANQREREENDAISVIENQREWETGEFWDWEEGVHASSRECMCVWRGERSRRNKSNSLCCRFSWIDSLRTVPLDVVSRRLFVHLCKRRPVDGIGLKFGRIDKIPRRFHRLCVCVP